MTQHGRSTLQLRNLGKSDTLTTLGCAACFHYLEDDLASGQEAVHPQTAL